MRKIISLICLLLPTLAIADNLQIREDAPDKHIVVKGDTLWDISAQFYKDPWKWPQIWELNKDEVKDPHWIYPGNVIYLDRSTGTLTVTEPSAVQAASAPESAPTMGAAPESAPEDNAAPSQPAEASNAVKLMPRARVVAQHSEAIPAIPLNVINSFLMRPLVVEDEDIETSPKLIGTYEHRELLAVNDIAYVQNLPSDKGTRWQIFRPSTVFFDPDTQDKLGQEVTYLGDATVEKFGDPSTLRITNAIMEIHKGDYFIQAGSGYFSNYQPHAPSSPISAKVISVYGGVQQAGQYSVITINKGRSDGVEVGHVLGLYQKGETLRTPGWFTPNIELPDVRYGLILVFRVFNKVSYALVMQTRLPVQLLDRASNPE